MGCASSIIDVNQTEKNKDKSPKHQKSSKLLSSPKETENYNPLYSTNEYPAKKSSKKEIMRPIPIYISA